jgi:hypothetical protein
MKKSDNVVVTSYLDRVLILIVVSHFRITGKLQRNSAGNYS